MDLYSTLTVHLYNKKGEQKKTKKNLVSYFWENGVNSK